ncbi:MAG: carbon-nitrogen hydrolase family protein [Christensenella sp.]|nr:carbon-nitrogen hydrolase family protein [Christensenella sp.]
MKVGLFQFVMTDHPIENMTRIRAAVIEAAQQDVELLLLPECALTGYPKADPHTIQMIDFQEAEHVLGELERLATEYALSIVAGTAEFLEGKYYNNAVLAKPGQKAHVIYRKRALWGWDADNFSPGDMEDGVFEIDGFRIGVRICFEVRFPEYFRELYRKKTDCAVVLFCDTSEEDSMERYDLIKSHLRTRAVENVFPVLSVNSSVASQTAPTAVIDPDGTVVSELPRHMEQLLLYELKKQTEESFGARGRRYISDKLT